MNAIIFNNITDFNTLENSIHEYLKSTNVKYKAECYAKPIYALDGSNDILLITGDTRLAGYDFSSYTVVDINGGDPKWFLQE